MAKIEIYTTTICPYCVRAKNLLKQKNVDFQEINVENSDLRDAMIKKTGGARSVPQIFINDQHIGGSDDLYELERKGELDGLLSSLA